jgi:hypothetical protein
MGKGFGIFLMILAAVIFFYGTTLVADSPYLPLTGNSVQIIAIIVFVIGGLVAFFSRPKPPRY